MRECIGTSRFFLRPGQGQRAFGFPSAAGQPTAKEGGSWQIPGPAAPAKRRQAEKKAGAPKSACRVSDNWSHSLISSCTHFRSVPKGIFMINTLFFDLLCWVRGLDAIWLVHWSYSPFLDFAKVLEMLVHGVHIFLFPPWRKIYIERGRFGGPEMHFRFAGSTLDFFLSGSTSCEFEAASFFSTTRAALSERVSYQRTYDIAPFFAVLYRFFGNRSLYLLLFSFCDYSIAWGQKCVYSHFAWSFELSLCSFVSQKCCNSL